MRPNENARKNESYNAMDFHFAQHNGRKQNDKKQDRKNQHRILQWKMKLFNQVLEKIAHTILLHHSIGVGCCCWYTERIDIDIGRWRRIAAVYDRCFDEPVVFS